MGNTSPSSRRFPTSGLARLPEYDPTKPKSGVKKGTPPVKAAVEAKGRPLSDTERLVAEDAARAIYQGKVEHGVRLIRSTGDPAVTTIACMLSLSLLMPGGMPASWKRMKDAMEGHR